MSKDKDMKVVMSEQVEEKENPVWEAMRNNIPKNWVEEIQKAQETAVCELDHGGDPRGPGPYPAGGTVMIKRGDGYVAIHVCDLCANSLAEQLSDWYLFICFTCMSTKWVYKTDVHHDYTEQIIGMDECPNCIGKNSTH